MFASSNRKLYQYLGSDTSSTWNLFSHSSDGILSENQRWRSEFSQAKIIDDTFFFCLAPDGAPILDTDATEVTQHSFVVSWGPGRQRLNGILRKYKIRWRKVDSANYHNETLIIESYHSRRRRDIIIPSNRTSFELKNLSLYTNYSVEIAAVTIKEGNYSSPKYFMTGEGGKGN